MWRDLLVFKTAVDSGSIAAAAKVLHMTQPAASYAIKRLESDLRANLLHRGKLGVRLSDAGKVAYSYSQRADKLIQDLRTDLNLHSQQAFNVSVGMIDDLATKILSGLYTRFYSKYPASSLNVEINNSRTLADLVIAGTLNLALISTPRKKNPLLSYTTFLDQEFWLVYKSKLTNKFICYPKTSHTFAQIDSQLRSQGFSPQYSISSSSPKVLLELAKRGIGACVLPKSICKTDVSVKKLKRADFVFTRKTSLITLKQAFLSSSTKAVAQLVKNLHR